MKRIRVKQKNDQGKKYERPQRDRGMITVFHAVIFENGKGLNKKVFFCCRQYLCVNHTIIIGGSIF